MRIGQHAFHRALAWAAAEQAALLESAHRLRHLIAVAGGRIEETVDTAGDVREGEVGADDAADADDRDQHHPE